MVIHYVSSCRLWSEQWRICWEWNRYRSDTLQHSMWLTCLRSSGTVGTQGVWQRSGHLEHVNTCFVKSMQHYMICSYLTMQWSQYVRDADWLSTVHCWAIQHHNSPCKNAGEQDESNSWPPLQRWVTQCLSYIILACPLLVITKCMTASLPKVMFSYWYYYQLSDCKDLLRCLLRSNPSERIKMADIMHHPWMNEGHHLPFDPHPFPNKLKLYEIRDEIVDHMIHTLKVGCSYVSCLALLIQIIPWYCR